MNGTRLFRDQYGRVFSVPSDPGDFWGTSTPNSPTGQSTVGGHPDIYDDQYNDYYNNKLMFAQTGPQFMQEPGKRDDLGGRDPFNPAAKRRNQTLVKKTDFEQTDRPDDNTLTGEVGQLVQVNGDIWGTLALKKLKRDNQLTAYALVDSPDMTSYFSQQGFNPAQTSPLADPLIGALAPTPVGGAVLIGQLTAGHVGASQDVLYDLPGNQLVKVPFNGSAGQLRARLWPKYYFVNDTVAGIRTYSIGDPALGISRPLTNVNWNNPLPTQMNLMGFVNVNPARVRGWISEGTNSSDFLGRATRTFYGSVIAGAIGSRVSICPIAWWSSGVMLSGGGITAGFVANSLKFTITDYQGVVRGPFPPNIIVPLKNDESITVYNDVATTVEAPFDLTYFLSF